MKSQTYRLGAHGSIARAACKNAIDSAKDGYVAKILLPSRSAEQNAKFHAMFADVARQCKHLNQCFDSEGWKRLLLDQFRTDCLAMPDLDDVVRGDLQDAVRMVPSLDGRSIVSIGLQSRTFRQKTAAMLLEWLNAWGAEHEVKYSAPKGAEEYR